jgi:DNA polymerase-4
MPPCAGYRSPSAAHSMGAAWLRPVLMKPAASVSARPCRWAAPVRFVRICCACPRTSRPTERHRHKSWHVPFGTEAAFLAPLPVSALWGVGPKTAEKLQTLGLHTIGDLAQWPESDLRHRFGKHGEELSRHARGLDDRELVTDRAAKSVSRETTFVRDVRDGDHLRRTLADQTRHLCRELQKEGVCGGTVRLKLRWPDFTTLTRQVSLPYPTDQEAVLLPLAQRLLAQAWSEGQAVRLLGVGVGSLEVPRQLNLWDMRPAEEAAQEKRLQTALTALQTRFGEGAVRRGVDLQNLQKKLSDNR